jgi:hypothetical protein
MTLKLIHIKEGSRYFRRSIKVRFKGFRKYEGDAKQICSSIVKDCWKGDYFQTSTGHFCEFFTRDFGWCVEALVNLGYRERVIKTLDFALEIFSRYDKVTVAISPDSIPFDFPSYSVDTLPFLIRSLRIAKASRLIDKYRSFLEKEILRFYDSVLDNDSGLVRKDKSFSSIKDYSKRKSSCYDNVMVAMLNEELKKLKLENPLKSYNFKKLIKDNLWTGSYFLDDLSGLEYVTGDSNVFPFWTGVFDSKKMLKLAINSVQERKLDEPFPLKYSEEKLKEHDLILIEVFSSNYERDAVWTHMGPLFIELVKRIDKNKAKEYLKKYTEVIEKYKNYLEVFNPDGSPYKSPFYYADEGMLWAAMYLDMAR